MINQCIIFRKTGLFWHFISYAAVHKDRTFSNWNFEPMHPSGCHALIRTMEWVNCVNKSACTLHPPCPPAPSLSSCYHHRASVLSSRAPPHHSSIDCADVIVITCHWYKERHKLEQCRRRQGEREWKKWGDIWEGFLDCCCCCCRVMLNMLRP